MADQTIALGKVAVVVGVGPGAGAGIAKKFAEHQYKVALVSRNTEALAGVESDIKKAGGTAISVVADTGNEADVKAAFQSIVKEFGEYPEVLVYNAGPGNFRFPPPGILDLSVEEFSVAFEAGVYGALAWLHQVLPAQIKAGKGTILFTGATASVVSEANFLTLAAPKFALRALAQSTAREFQSKGIHVAHVIIDGTIISPRVTALLPGLSKETALLPDAIGEEFWKLHTQHRSTWSQEIDLRPVSQQFFRWSMADVAAKFSQ